MWTGWEGWERESERHRRSRRWQQVCQYVGSLPSKLLSLTCIFVYLYTYIYIHVYTVTPFKLCEGRARPRGPGGSMKHQFVYVSM